MDPLSPVLVFDTIVGLAVVAHREAAWWRSGIRKDAMSSTRLRRGSVRFLSSML